MFFEREILMLTPLAHIPPASLHRPRKPQRLPLPLPSTNFPLDHIRQHHRIKARLTRARHGMRPEARQRIPYQHDAPIQELIRRRYNIRNSLNKRPLRRTHQLRKLRRQHLPRPLHLPCPRARIHLTRRHGNTMIRPVAIRHQLAQRGRRLVQRCRRHVGVVHEVDQPLARR